MTPSYPSAPPSGTQTQLEPRHSATQLFQVGEPPGLGLLLLRPLFILLKLVFSKGV